MGNIAYHLFSSISTSGLTKSCESPPAELLSKPLTSIEERCENLSGPFSPFIGSHSYLILHTEDGDQIRIDYTAQSTEPNITFNYKDIGQSESFRLAKAHKSLTMSQGLKIVRKHCIKERYDWQVHNCQHVSRDSFAEIAGLKTELLRNDYLRWFKKSISEEMRKDFEWDDYEQQNAKMLKKAIQEHGVEVERILNPMLSKEGYEKMFEELVERIKREKENLEDERTREWSEGVKRKMMEEMRRRMEKRE